MIPITFFTPPRETVNYDIYNTSNIELNNFIYINSFQNEIWRDLYINGIHTHFIISTFGRVININRKCFSKLCIDEFGYIRFSIQICGKYYYKLVHRLVMMAFYPINNPDEYQVNHIDGNKMNNSVWNLEWCTYQQNMDHSWEIGLRNNCKGTSHCESIFNDDEIHKICFLLELGLDYTYILNQIGKGTTKIISDIAHGRTYRDISKKYNIELIYPNYNENPNFNEDQIHMMCKMIKENPNISYNVIFDALNIDISDKIKRRNLVNSIVKMRSGNRYRNIASQYFDFDN